MNRFLTLLSVGGLLLASSPALHAQEVNPAEAMMKRMRETLRNTMIQLQTAQAEVATLQAKQTESETKIAELESKLTALTKKSDADKLNAEKTATELNAKIATKTQENVALTQSLDKWKAGYKQAAEVANATEAKRVALSEKTVMLEREVSDMKRRNLELYRLGSEILTRYEKFGLGKALLAREPFTGIAKVKFQTLVQDYADKLVDQKLRPGVEDGGETAASAASPSAPAPAPASVPASKEKLPEHKS